MPRPTGLNRFWAHRTPADSSWLVGGALIGVCLLAAGLLVLQHFSSLNLPGCGPQSDCARAAASRWGSVAGWPVSFLGLAYAVAAAGVWFALARQGVPVSLRYTVRVAALASAGFLLVMLLGGYACLYCLAVHVSNLGFWLLTERRAEGRGPILKPAIALLASFALVSSLLSVALSEQQRTVQVRARRALEESIQQIKAQQQRAASPQSAAGSSLAARSGRPERTGSAPAAEQTAGQPQAVTDSGPADVSSEQSRFPLGPPDAEVRLVVYQDYQCQVCQLVDRDVQTLLRQYADTMSVTVRHFPLCVDCNFALNVTVHKNACRAARAAEAAGVLQGNDGFWRMHRWLFERGGTFTEQELRRGLGELGFPDRDLFLETMDGEQVSAAILADILDGQALAIEGTPTVVLNGVMLAGLEAENAIALAVVAATEAADEAVDQAVTAQPTADSRPFEQGLVAGLEERLQQTALSATVRISDGDRRGSGVVVAVREPFAYALTANHVVAQSSTVRVEWFAADTYPRVAGQNPAAAIVAQSETDDLALLRFSLPASRPSRLPLAGTFFDTSGFAALTVGCTAGEPPTCQAVKVIGKQRIRRRAGSPTVDVWEISGTSEHGRSGGPLVHPDGVVLGIASGMSDGRSYFCEPRAIRRMLAESGLSWLSALAAEPLSNAAD